MSPYLQPLEAPILLSESVHLTTIIMTLKINLPVILPAKMGLFGHSREEQDHRQAWRTKEREEALLERRGGNWEGCYKHWSKLGVQSIVAFHQLSCDSISLPGLLPDNRRIFFFSSSYRGSKVVAKVVSICKADLSLLGLQLTRTCRA